MLPRIYFSSSCVKMFSNFCCHKYVSMKFYSYNALPWSKILGHRVLLLLWEPISLILILVLYLNALLQQCYSFIHTAILNAIFYFPSHTHLILLQHVLSLYGHHQICVSHAQIVSLYTLFCQISILWVNFLFIFEVNFWNYLFIEIKAH
jgi:hypothetical protein